MSLSVLVIDDDESIRETLIDFFASLGYTARGASTATEGRQLAREHAPNVVLLDLRLPDASGLVALEALRADDPDVAIIVLSGYADVRSAVRAMHHGAADVLEKPVDLDTLSAAVTRASERGRLRQEVAVLRAQTRSAHQSYVTEPIKLPHTIEQLIDLAARNLDAPVLLQGETGTGKGFVARQIHDRSERNSAPFVEVNCASLSTSFFESELFGHERGAFTDARQAKRGLLEVAAAGSVFLDEIAEMSADVQPRFLKVLEDKSFRRLGGTTSLRSDARVIVATHQPLTQAVANGTFRADLYYRLQVLTLTIPPLRARPAEILPLAHAFLPRGATLDPSAEAQLLTYEWPGNIRELKNTIWRAAILADGAPIRVDHLGLVPLTADATPVPSVFDTTPRTLESIERDAIRTALAATNGNRTHAAHRLAIARSTLMEKIKRYQL
ncbi:MAG: sigma-54-dependent Fis family transcriptional regulator [Gemmatimonadaceae bacterium]|nr:sigma-54-dependent Fis family transcriptional regulator [Gemmatimonadaceae bacterium]